MAGMNGCMAGINCSIGHLLHCTMLHGVCSHVWHLLGLCRNYSLGLCCNDGATSHGRDGLNGPLWKWREWHRVLRQQQQQQQQQQ